MDVEVVEAEIVTPRLDVAEREIAKAIGTPFLPGTSGNPRGRPPKRIHLSSMLTDRLDEPCKADVKLAEAQKRPVRTNLEVLCDYAIKAAVRQAEAGNLKPFQMVIETAYGKAPKELVHSGQVDHTGTVVHEHNVNAEQLMAQMRGRLEALRQNDQKKLPETTE